MSYTVFQPPLKKKRTVFLGSISSSRHSSRTDQQQYLINKHGSIPIYGISQSARSSNQTAPEDEFGDTISQESGKQPVDSTDSTSRNTKDLNEYQVVNYEDNKNFSNVSSNKTYKELATFSITGLSQPPNTNSMGVSETEQSLNILLGPKIKYKWFVIEGLDDSDSIVFVKLIDENDELIFSTLKWLFLLKTDIIKVALHSGLKEYLGDYLKLHSEEIKTEKMDEQDVDMVNKEEKPKKDEDPKIEQLKLFMKSLKSQTLFRGAKPVDDLDYVIDENELRGIPEEYIPQLTKDIKEFRLNVIKIEKQKKAKEKREAIKRNKEQLKLLYKQFSNGEVKDEEDEDEEDEEDDEEGLTDEQYEARKQLLKAEQTNKLYNANLIKVKNEEKQNLELSKRLQIILNYESELSKLNSDIDHDKYRDGEFKYNTNVSITDRAVELQKDQADRELEEREEQDQPKNKEEDFEMNNQQEQQIGEEKIIITDSKLQISDDELTAMLKNLTPKLNEYVTKFLGFEEPEMVELIVTVVVEFKDKLRILEEVKDVFDENAEELTELIWNDLKEVITKQ